MKLELPWRIFFHVAVAEQAFDCVLLSTSFGVGFATPLSVIVTDVLAVCLGVCFAAHLLWCMAHHVFALFSCVMELAMPLRNTKHPCIFDSVCFLSRYEVGLVELADWLDNSFFLYAPCNANASRRCFARQRCIETTALE